MNNHFVWDGSPVMVELGPIALPFALSIPALILSAAIYFGALYLLEKPGGEKAGKSRRKTKTPTADSSLSGWVRLGIAAGAVVLPQILLMAADTPSISQLGPIAVRWYGLMFAMSFLIGYYLGSKTFEHAGKPQQQPETLFLYLIVATVFGARFGHVFFYDFDYYIRNLHEIFYFWQGGLASHGAVIGVLTAIWLFSRKFPDSPFLWVGDRIAIPFTLGGALVRIGNFFNSEILGRETDVAWAVIFAREDLLPRHPAMLYESAMYLLLFIVMLGVYRYYRHNPPVGSISGLFLAGIFLSRFLIEYTKERQPGFDESLTLLSMGQILSLPFIAAGLWLLVSKVNWRQPGPTPDTTGKFTEGNAHK
jgi:phosphatidylglycerol---prolipoprotein diacylglyceryl transferase